jgi:hypothetical protein
MSATSTGITMEPINSPGSLDEPATDTSAHVVDAPIAQSPFFRLPRELRDESYELAVLSQKTFFYDITLRADTPAQKAAYIDRGARRTFSNSQFEVEFSAVAERRIKSLVGGRDGNGLRLEGPGPQGYWQRTSAVGW